MLRVLLADSVAMILRVSLLVVLCLLVHRIDCDDTDSSSSHSTNVIKADGLPTSKFTQKDAMNIEDAPK